MEVSQVTASRPPAPYGPYIRPSPVFLPAHGVTATASQQGEVGGGPPGTSSALPGGQVVRLARTEIGNKITG